MKDVLMPFRDASEGPSLFQLTFDHCIRALYYSKFMKLQNQQNFDHFTYEYFSQLQNGYLNWVVKDKLLAFCSPAS